MFRYIVEVQIQSIYRIPRYWHRYFYVLRSPLQVIMNETFLLWVKLYTLLPGMVLSARTSGRSRVVDLPL